MAKAISALTPASSAASADIVPGVQGGITKYFTMAMIRLVGFLSAGVAVASRPAINFINGSSIQVDVADDVPNNRVNVTVSSTATPNNDPATKVFKYQNFQ